VKCEVMIAGLASEGLVMISGSAGAGSSAVVGPTPTDPVEFRKCARDLKTLSAAQKHTNEERGFVLENLCFLRKSVLTPAGCEWRAADAGLKPLRLPYTRNRFPVTSQHVRT